jgi:hypothetical protein
MPHQKSQMDEKNRVGKLNYTLVEPRFGDDGCWSFVSVMVRQLRIAMTSWRSGSSC